jgi:diguanylate cyclase (GGDEF)-like protein/PAS domain S-box-containing protein
MAAASDPDRAPQASGGAAVERRALLAAIEAAREAGTGVAVIHLDVDRFRQVNRMWGQAVGDDVLDILWNRLVAGLAADSVLVRTGGDVYVAAVAGADLVTARVAAELLLAVVRQPVVLESSTLVVQATAGIAADAPDDRHGDLLEQAFTACRRAKTTEPGAVVAYEALLDAEAGPGARTADALRRALVDGELRLHVQPTLDLRDGRVVGVEALVRWQHPVDGLLLPGEFLPMAETAGLMVDIGDWVLDAAIALAARWRRTQSSPIRVWVNLAAQQLTDAGHLSQRIRAGLDQGLISPQGIGFEVTESSLLEDLPSAVEALSALRALGMEIALDDFGTGYSSLTYLRQLPVTALKIDRSFVAGIGGSLADEAIVEAVIDLAHAFVVAEGVEDVAQAQALVRMGADQAQGFHFSRPGAPAAVEALLGLPWCGAEAPIAVLGPADRRADVLPGFGSRRARLLLTALDTAHDSIIVTAASAGGSFWSPILYVNAAFEAETGFRPGDVVGHTVEMLLPEQPDSALIAWFAQAHADERSATTELPSRRADGSTFLCELTLSPIYDERGVHTHWLHVRRDLTERRAAEEAQARFQWLTEKSASLVFIAETGGNWVYANEAQRRAVGLPLTGSLGEINSFDVLTAEQAEQFFDDVSPALDAHDVWTGGTAMRNIVTGATTEVMMELKRLDDPLRPGVTFYAAVSRDVSEQQSLARAERRRRELADFASGLAERALDQGRDQLLGDVDSVLAAFGMLVRADVTHLDAIDLDAGVMRPIGGWRSDRSNRGDAPPTEISLDQLPRWVEHLQTTGLLRGDAGDSISEWGRELAGIFSNQLSGPALSAPLRVGGVLIGVLGLARIDGEEEWTSDETSTIQQVADTLANLLGRQRADRALRESEARSTALLAGVADVLIVIDRDGWIKYGNGRVAAVLGYPLDEVVGHHFLELVHPDDHSIAIERFGYVVGGDADLPMTELRIVCRDGSEMWFDVDTAGVEDPLSGGFMVSLRNVSQQHVVLESVERQADASRIGEARLAALLDGSQDLVVVVGDDGTISYANGAVERSLGYTNRELMGMNVAAVVHPDDLTMASVRLTSLLSDEPTEMAAVRLLAVDGSAETWEITSGIMRDPIGGGRVLTCRNITERLAAEAAASVRVEHLQYAFDLAQLAIDLDPDVFLARLSGACRTIATMLGVDFVYVDRLDESVQLLVNLAGLGDNGTIQVVEPGGAMAFARLPNWLERLRRGEPVVERDATASNELWALEKRAVLGSEAGMVAIGMMAAGELFGVLGVSMRIEPRDWTADEVTFLRIVAETIAHVLERSRLDRALRASESRFQLLSETAADVVLLIDASGLVAYASPSSFGLLGITPEELIGRPAQSLVAPGHFDRLVQLNALLPAGAPLATEVELICADGSTVWVANCTSTVFDPISGCALEYRSSVRDISDRKRLEAELQRQALHDPLTGLGNRTLLRNSLERAAEGDRSDHLSVLLVDLDGFKDVNDTYGHVVGDDVLRIVSARLAGLSRPTDTLARTGGDEFVMLCPSTPVAGAVTVAERIIAALRHPISLGTIRVHIGASIGIAHQQGRDADPDLLLLEADRAMYAAKHEGRNQVRVAADRHRTLEVS